ncbi:uncharacterized protein Z520_03007 [Fonsecaea multimorphosa CBS 102226]|uniref:Uncharacterized protein n=1 Tax=Fonsecaea multimorphosa CBS 102226 TaxID=1442371 RepID=A0A0D2KDV2_9EURO|nr:uncharacterized protein Z520_03007 [Fonsecaea multimorphosa CBS 102226]KIY01455.1 hypothetical protein Z520_03007 [Fonsecaea multimorphosa CBS 102226]
MDPSSRAPRTLPVFTLEGKNCLVTGGAGGLGKECITGFALSGANCACIDLDLDSCQTTLKEISARVLQESGIEAGSMRGYACNVTDEDDVKKTINQVVQDFGQIDVLVTCAGTTVHREAEATDLATWSKVLDINLNGTYLFGREVGKHMLDRNIPGSLIFIASGAGTRAPRPQAQASYNASKAGVKLLAASLAIEWGSRGIRVNSLSPGYLDTPLSRKQFANQVSVKPVPDLKEQWLRQIPLGRFADPSELQGTLVWMASAASSYLTGSDVIVDGAWSA